MNLGDFTVRMTTAIQQMVYPKISSNQIAKVEVGVIVAAAAHKFSKKAGDGGLSRFGLVDKGGNVDFDLIEAAIGNGIEWPLKLELPFSGVTLKFDKSDWETLIGATRGDAK